MRSLTTNRAEWQVSDELSAVQTWRYTLEASFDVGKFSLVIPVRQPANPNLRKIKSMISLRLRGG